MALALFPDAVQVLLAKPGISCFSYEQLSRISSDEKILILIIIGA